VSGVYGGAPLAPLETNLRGAQGALEGILKTREGTREGILKRRKPGVGNQAFTRVRIQPGT